MNQCDGCNRGLPLDNGIHRGDGYDFIGCTKELYMTTDLEETYKDAVSYGTSFLVNGKRIPPEEVFIMTTNNEDNK